MSLLNDSTSRLRMFAGPNGSGKSTMKTVLRKELLGVYVNPDEIEAFINRFDFLDFGQFGIQTDETEVLSFFQNSTLLKNAGLLDQANCLRLSDNKLFFYEIKVNAYLASVAADFIRQKLILAAKSFSFETVMSSSDKIELLKRAQQNGYRTYLYFIATNDPNINISRVAERVKRGGHDVPRDKIKSRFYRSLELLNEAIKFTNRAFIFDNSGSGLILLAEVTNAVSINAKVDLVPTWFERYVLNKFARSGVDTN